MAERNTSARYVWGSPDLNLDDAPDDRRLLFAIRLGLFHIAGRFAYTRRRRVIGTAVAVLLSLTATAVVLAADGALGWVLVALTAGPASAVAVWRHRGIWVSGASPGP